MPAPPPASIDAYLAAVAPSVQERLAAVRATIRAAVPEATETISYGMPAFKLDGRALLYFAAHRGHIGVYPLPAGDEALAAALAPYRSGKGTMQLPHDAPLPLALLHTVAQHRADDVRRAGSRRPTRGPAA